MSSLEVRTERDVALDLFSSSQLWEPCVRVLYRRPPARKWTRFLLRPNVGQSIEELERLASAAAEHHERNAGGDRV